MKPTEEQNVYNNLRKMGLTDEEAKEVISADKAIDKGEKLFELTEEQKQVEKKYKNTHTRTVKTAYGQTQTKDLKLFVDMSGETYDDYDDVPFTTLVPAFILSELRTAFILGFLIYIPFIVIDMVVSSVLMSMGMMMLPPTTISLPFKVLLFILADGWDLVIGNLVKTFY